jgi:phosphoribosylformylglycinamidine synthase
VRGLGEACRALEAPIVGGNVSLYNEGATGPIYPTPVIGMVGLLPDARRAGRLGFASAGDEIALVGPFAPSLAASELAKLRGQALPDGLAEIDVDAVREVQAAVREAVRDGSLSSAHDVAEGGLAVALAECCLAGGLGAEITLDAGTAAALGAAEDAETVLFGEGPGGFLVSGEAGSLERLATRVALRRLGTVGGDSLAIEAAGEGAILASLEDLSRAHGKLAELFG